MINNRLKTLREKKNLTQDELSKELNVSRQALCNWEKATREPNIEMIIKIADYFNVSTDYLLGRTNIENFIETNKEYCKLNNYIIDCMKIYNSYFKEP